MSGLNSQKLWQLLESGEASPLEDTFEIEDVLTFINSMDDRILFYNNLKKNRAKTIQKEIDKLEKKKQILKDIIILTLEQEGKKSLTFPGVGRVSVKKRAGKWIVNDQDSLIDFLKDELPDNEYEKIVQQKDVLVKKELNALLDKFESIQKVPSSVKRESDESLSLTVRMDKDADLEEVDLDGDTQKNDSNEYDGLGDKIAEEGAF